MPNFGAITIFQSEDVKFPNGESVEDYVRELPERALSRLEYMTYQQEKNAMDRYMNMYNAYYDGTLTRRLTAVSFASKSYTKKFAEEYLENDNLEDGARVMSDKTSRSILHFLFVYYFSYHEAEEAGQRRIKIVSFSTWFDRLRKKLGRKMRNEIEMKDKSYARLAGRRRESYVQQLKKGRKIWKLHWKQNGYASSEKHFEEMKHVVNMADFEGQDWWKVFKIPESRVHETPASYIYTEVRKKFRVWSRFLHTDNDNNRALGLPFEHRLAQRFLLLSDKKADAETWYNSMAIDVD